jgi:hypothetical protein
LPDILSINEATRVASIAAPLVSQGHKTGRVRERASENSFFFLQLSLTCPPHFAISSKRARACLAGQRESRTDSRAAR